MKTFLDRLKKQLEHNPPNLGSSHSILEMLYDCHNENNPYDNSKIKADFNSLYQEIDGIPLREMDKVINTVCILCRDHEQAGFTAGVRIGFYLTQEMS